jgi:hypothetical protein
LRGGHDTDDHEHETASLTPSESRCLTLCSDLAFAKRKRYSNVVKQRQEDHPQLGAEAVATRLSPKHTGKATCRQKGLRDTGTTEVYCSRASSHLVMKIYPKTMLVSLVSSNSLRLSENASPRRNNVSVLWSDAPTELKVTTCRSD